MSWIKKECLNCVAFVNDNQRDGMFCVGFCSFRISVKFLHKQSSAEAKIIWKCSFDISVKQSSLPGFKWGDIISRPVISFACSSTMLLSGEVMDLSLSAIDRKVGVECFLTDVVWLPWRRQSGLCSALRTHKVKSLGFVCRPSFSSPLVNLALLSRGDFYVLCSFYYAWGK